MLENALARCQGTFDLALTFTSPPPERSSISALEACMRLTCCVETALEICLPQWHANDTNLVQIGRIFLAQATECTRWMCGRVRVMQLETVFLDNDAIALPTDHDWVVRFHMLMNGFNISEWQYSLLRWS